MGLMPHWTTSDIMASSPCVKCGAVRALLVVGALGASASLPFPRAADRAGALPGARVLAASPFLFYSALYADPRLRPRATAIAAWLTSDVPGVGAASSGSIADVGRSAPWWSGTRRSGRRDASARRIPPSAPETAAAGPAAG